jgi:DNA polymerase III delta prime subunit
VPDGTEPRLADGFLAEDTFLEGGLVIPAGNGHLKAWTAFGGFPALLLLGPPGIGKTTEVKAMADLEIPPVALIDLAEVASTSDLDELFAVPTVEAWESGAARLTLFLDAYDEGRTDAKTLGSALLRRLRKGPANALSVRITCRDADRPRTLEAGLRDLLGHVEVYSLAPLTWGHAYWIAAETLGKSRAHAFMAEVDRVGARPLAAAPLTLRQLVGDYQQNDRLTDDRVELFEGAVGRLAVETSPARREMDRTGVLTRDENVALAARVAALLQFSGRTALRLDNEPDPSALTLDDVAGAGDTAWTGSVPVQQAVRELVLHSGLFAASGHGHRFVHRSYEEFLAARFLAKAETPPDGVWSLARHPDGTFRPQHRETLAWLAAMSDDVREALTPPDPVTALRYVRRDLTPEAKRQAVEAFLQAHDDDRLTYGTRLPNLDRLVFDDLGDVVERWVRDTARSTLARIAAVEIAGDAELKAMTDALVETALATEDPTLRRRATVVALRLGGPAAADALAPLERLTGDEDLRADPDRSTAFAVRAARFPDRLSFSELAGQLAAESEHVTIQSSQVAEHFATKSIAEADLPAAVLADGLGWLAERPRLDAATAHVANAVVGAAWPLAKDLADALVAALLPSREGHVQPVAMVEWPSTDLPDVARRALVEAAVRADASDYDPSPPYPHLAPRVGALATPSRRVLRHEDLAWALERHRDETDPARKVVWALAADHGARFPDDADALEAIASPDDPATEILYHTHFAPDPKRPERTRWEARVDHQAQRDAEIAARVAERETPVPPDPPVVEAVLAAAARVTDGDPSAWSDVVHHLRRDPDDARVPFGLDWHDDLGRARAWGALPPRDQAAVAVAALLAVGLPDANLQDEDVVAALRILEEVGRTGALDDATLARHAGALVRAPVANNGTDTLTRRADLLEQAYRAAPEAVLDALRAALAGSDSPNTTAAYVAARFWDDPVADIVAEAAETTPSLLAAHDFLHLLALQGDSRTASIALGRAEALQTDPEAFETDGLRFVTDAFYAEPVTAWNYMVETIPEGDLRHAVLVHLAHVGPLRSVDDVPVPVREDLARRLAALADVNLPGGRDDAETVEAFRFQVLRSLASTGAVDALERLTHPTIEGLLRNARDARASHAPEYRSPREALELSKDPDAAPIRSDAELQTAVIRSLARLQDQLTDRRHGPSHLLWNTTDPVRPKGEEELSSFIARHLEDELGPRGVSVVREAEALQGSETDILVLRPSDGDGEAQVIVEVKGAWNDEYASGLTEQLAGRYLHETGRRHGVHLVASFEKAHWDPKDWRHKASPAPDHVQNQIEERAAEAAQEGYHVEPVVLQVGPHRSIPHR